MNSSPNSSTTRTRFTSAELKLEMKLYFKSKAFSNIQTKEVLVLSVYFWFALPRGLERISRVPLSFMSINVTLFQILERVSGYCSALILWRRGKRSYKVLYL